MSKRTATAALLAASFMWGSSFVASKICINHGMLQFEIVFYRFLLGTVLLGFLFRKYLMAPTRRAIETGVVLGIITCFGFTMEMFGLTLTQATKAAFLTSTNLVLLPLMYCLWKRMWPSRYTVGATVLAMTGVGFLSLTDGFGSIALGDVLLLGAAVSYAAGSMAIVCMGERESGIQITFFQFATTALGMGVATLFQGTTGVRAPAAMAASLYLAIFPTAVCYLIKNIAIKHIHPVHCTLILSVECIFCALISAVLLRDVLTLKMLFGAVLIVGGILLEILRPGQKLKEEAPCTTN